jgi:hypothetical protein
VWRARHSITVLYRFYAKVIHGSQQKTNEQIQRVPDEADEDEM